ncbi:cupin domain-containing protein [Spirosoma rhododendri]|uniref:Cupin domain-containing protein n=1 Tax=Spirosoma rhododendri TaxID=2728024 RepID=A0A7L5DRF8_9BACT|nr:cupin domain-containing protein [Spirosoma rhododendri]QJD78240.1 cupin domain-containing protein [Spirosoma rhododendri]
MNAQEYVQTLQMQSHPEGGYFAETYRSAEMVAGDALPERFGGSRAMSTAIYFLLESHHISALHRIQSDEVWHFYDGGPLDVFVIDPAGELYIIRLGRDLSAGEVFQAVVPAGCWFGSKPAVGTAFSLVGCTVAPGFDFADFELADQEALLAEFPQHAAVIRQLT